MVGGLGSKTLGDNSYSVEPWTSEVVAGSGFRA